MSVPIPPRPDSRPISAVEASLNLKTSNRIRNASKVPVIVGVLFWLFSAILTIYTATNSLLESDNKETIIHVVGYLLTPLGVVLCLAWDMLSQRKGMHDVNFFPRAKFTQTLRFLTVTSFLISWFHIAPIAKAIADGLAS